MQVKEVADKVWKYFLEQGNFKNTSKIPFGSTGFSLDAKSPQVVLYSVAYTVGVPKPKIYIFCTKKNISKKDQETLRIFVEENFASQYGFDVSVEVSGNIQIDQEKNSNGTVFVHDDKIACGSSCAPGTQNYSGTFGAIVKKDGDEENCYIVSNNHILSACNDMPPGMPILSPSNMDTRPGFAAGEIATLSDIIALKSGNVGFVNPCKEDIALAKITGVKQITSWQGDSSNGYDTPIDIVDCQSYMRVKKFGRTTGLTHGTILCKNVPTQISFNMLSLGYAWFSDFYIVQGDDGFGFSSPGDSGSLVVTEDGRSAVGLIFAGDEYFTFIFPFSHLAQLFGGIKLVNNYG